MKGFTLVVLAVAALAGAAVPAAAAGRSPERGSPRTKAPRPDVVCLKDSGAFTYRQMPRHCSFYDAGAPGTRIRKSADFPTRGVSWTHWGHRYALGRGQYRVSGRWLPLRLKLLRPRTVCGRRVFTGMRMNLKTCPTRWSGWSRPIAVESCAGRLHKE